MKKGILYFVVPHLIRECESALYQHIHLSIPRGPWTAASTNPLLPPLDSRLSNTPLKSLAALSRFIAADQQLTEPSRGSEIKSQRSIPICLFFIANAVIVMDYGFSASDDLSPLEIAGGGQFFLIRLPRDVSSRQTNLK